MSRASSPRAPSLRETERVHASRTGPLARPRGSVAPTRRLGDDLAMILAAGNVVRSPRSRAWLGSLLLLAYVAMVAHAVEPGHAETEKTCAVCIAAERLDDVVLDSGACPPGHILMSRAPSPGLRSVAPADVPVAASRGPPISV